MAGITPYNPLTDTLGESAAHIVLDAVGSYHTRKAASQLVRPNGQILHIGLQDNQDGLDTSRLTLQEIRFQGTYCYQNKDFAAALSLLTKGVIKSDIWCDTRPLEAGVQSFWDVHNGTALPKIIFDCQ